MEFSKRELTFFYHPEIIRDRESLAYAKTVTDNIKVVEINKITPTPTDLKTIADTLGVSVSDMVNRQSELFRDEYEDKSFEDDQWLMVLVKNPALIKTPFAIMGERGIVCNDPADVMELIPETGNSLKR